MFSKEIFGDFDFHVRNLQGQVQTQTTSETSTFSSSSAPQPSLSRQPHADTSQPPLVHSLHDSEKRSSVLSLAATEEYIFSGTQCQYISVWDKKTFALANTLRGHTGSVLALEYAKEKQWLFSSSGDSTVRIWSTASLKPIYVLDPYLDIIFIGCQNTSLQWYDFNTLAQVSTPPATQQEFQSPTPGTATPGGSIPRKAHKFFDSYPQYERKPADIFANNGMGSRAQGANSPELDADAPQQGYLSVPASNVIDSAHFGYIYCMALLTTPDGSLQLATGSGDEQVKLWSCTPKGPVLVHEFACAHGAVLAIVAKDDTIYAGCQDGYVKVLDLETKTLVRTIIVQEGVDIISVSLIGSDLYTCSADGWVNRWSASFDCTASWAAHDGIVLSSTVTQRNGTDKDFRLVTGGNDSCIKIWEVLPSKEKRPQASNIEIIPIQGPEMHTETMIYALSRFVSIPSISSSPSNREDCRQAAIWLKKCLAQLGAHTTLLPMGEEKNPIVLGTFEGTKSERAKLRVLFYGHYDVIPAPPEGWLADPFTLTGRNGCLYGRGVTDDKGPIIAVACAAANLLAQRALEIDLVFLIEGEEECGSTGFGDCVRQHKDRIGHIDAILVSNSNWIAEDTPCITYGLRGVVHCALEISSDLPDLHSGIEGGAVQEPMFDMIKILSTLTDNQRRVQIPGFYEHVRPQTAEEEGLYRLLSGITRQPASSLVSRWREPSLTVHTIEISGPKNATVIPGTVKAQISLRIVPDQDIDTIIQSLCGHLKNSFDAFGSPNKLDINVRHTADWWLGNLDDPWFKALEDSVREEWGMEPLRIREGGSIPSVPWLEKEFGCHALHLPMGQSSDQAHLPNERISLVNLNKGRAVVQRFLRTVVERNIPPTN